MVLNYCNQWGNTWPKFHTNSYQEATRTQLQISSGFSRTLGTKQKTSSGTCSQLTPWGVPEGWKLGPHMVRSRDNWNHWIGHRYGKWLKLSASRYRPKSSWMPWTVQCFQNLQKHVPKARSWNLKDQKDLITPTSGRRNYDFEIKVWLSNHRILEENALFVFVSK